MNFQAKTLETLNPFESLEQEQAHTKEILDFRILDFKLLCQSQSPAKTKTYERKDFDLFYADDFFVKNYELMKQKFLIELYAKTQKDSFTIKLKSNANLTELRARVHFMEDFRYYTGLKFDILQSLYKTMIRQGFLILRLDKALFKKVNDLVLALQNKLPAQDFELNIAKGVEKIEHKSDAVIYHRNIDEVYFNENANYDERNYCKPVEKNELLFEYIYRVLGREGRNLRGEILPLKPVEFLDNPFIITDESIYTQEFEDRIKYFSASYGFLNKNHIGYSVANTLKVSQVGLKTTGSIKTNVNENMNLEITHFDLNDDVIKSGIVNIQASNIKVNGSVGATKLYGKNISIKGLTHAKSEIFAQNAFIATHKGNLQAHTVYIKNLENGSVVAKNVFVENCMGAKIEAENIYICNLLDGNTLYPKKNLIIAHNLKFKNNIHISPLPFMKNNADKEYENIKNLSFKIKSKLNETISKMQNFYDYLTKNQVKIIQIQKSKNPNIMEIKFLKLYEDIIEKYKQLSFLYKKLARLNYQVDSKLKFLDEMIYKAKIYIKAEKIGDDNFVHFHSNINVNLKLKHNISLRDYEKVLSLKKGQQAIYISANAYEENEILQIQELFEKLRAENS